MYTHTHRTPTNIIIIDVAQPWLEIEPPDDEK